MNYIILDLEATCWKEKGKYQSEIIEIGAVKVNENCEIISEFSEFIKPTINPTLSEFCKNLTSIKQIDIDRADNFKIVAKRFTDWIEIETNYLLCSWGFYDKNQLQMDCEFHNLNDSWVIKHISLKHQYAQIKRLTKPIGMGGALKMDNLKLEGIHHRGIDDARNICKLFLKHKNNWKLK